MVIKMKLLIFLALRRFGLGCKYGIIFQIQHIIGCRIAFTDIKDVFSLFAFLN